MATNYTLEQCFVKNRMLFDRQHPCKRMQVCLHYWPLVPANLISNKYYEGDKQKSLQIMKVGWQALSMNIRFGWKTFYSDNGYWWSFLEQHWQCCCHLKYVLVNYPMTTGYWKTTRWRHLCSFKRTSSITIRDNIILLQIRKSDVNVCISQVYRSNEWIYWFVVEFSELRTLLLHLIYMVVHCEGDE